MKFKLYRHQELALNYMRMNDSFGLFMDMGTGKTLTVLTRILELLKNNKINNCLVICPKPVIGSWYSDFDMFKYENKKLLEKSVTVTNYEQLITKGGKKKYMEKVWDCIVLDESHYIKNRTAKRSKACLELSLSAKYRYILTGTPVSNGQLENIYSQFAFLHPIKSYGRIQCKLFKTWTKFCDRYCVLNQWWQPYRYVNVDELQDIISQHSYRVTKEECLDLPDKLPDQIFEIELKEKKLYRELHEHSTVEEYEILADNPLSRLSKLRQVASGFINTKDETKILKNGKIPVLSDFLDDFDKKLVIFCEFKHSIQQVTELLEKKKIKYVVLDGNQKDKSVWKQFQEKDKIQVMVAQYQSASTGIDLFASDTIIFYEPTLSSNILEQARDRIHRIGQKNKCSYIFFLTKGTVERNIYRSLKDYADFNEKLFEEYMKEYQRSYGKR